ncbi:CPBP family intramembrane glutamic endopeptidase [Salisediminibacterium beveridgei]|uniref:CAAX amino terminal protease family protein n=1 Tax=Salisediminibacterium beveridgei TaxID=632773 RepID=A0A1D7QUS8_9BACI|nr:CPBP family intramembrane glutamic endopeptidase [Salisediminibacterium beveridgei]AOM82773.1 CAAX amino terminal protease family protein [Salisediminibacterium beveridgei]
MKRQIELVDQMTDRELLLNVYATQIIILSVAFGLSWIISGSPVDWIKTVSFSADAILAGVIFAVIIVALEIFMDKHLPHQWLDDGGINERLFRSISPFHILILTAIIGISEEILFRGVIQEQFGLVVASVLFAAVHVRYWHNRFLFSFMVVLSFMFGLVYLWSGNLLSVIIAHVLIDFLLGLYIKKTSAKIER